MCQWRIQKMKNPIDEVLQREGGFVNHKANRGGPTKFGITQKTYSHYLGHKASLQEVKDMTLDTAKEIYERNYFTGPRINTLPEPPRTFVLDMSINHGPKTAIKILQRVTNAAGFGPITIDGVVGPNTRSAVENAQTSMGNMFQNALVEERIRFYESIIARDPTQEVFRKGWINRAKSFIL